MQFSLHGPAETLDLLESELVVLGARGVRSKGGRLWLQDNLEVAYGACLWSRVATRVVAVVLEAQTPEASALYEAALSIPWGEHLPKGVTFAVDAHVRRSDTLRRREFVAQKVKDAVVDQLRAERGVRPDVDPRRPGVLIRVEVDGANAIFGIDLGGGSLHQRGLRRAQGEAPLKEHVAAAMLLRARWPELCKEAPALMDPMCGSATLLIEGAWMARDRAPRLGQRLGLERWGGHDRALWRQLVEQAEERARAGQEQPFLGLGRDIDPHMVRLAREHVARAGLEDVISIEPGDVASLPRAPAPRGLVVTNPPYGERMGGRDEIVSIYRRLGQGLKEHYSGWQFTMISSEPAHAFELGLRAHAKHTLQNGPLTCAVLHFDLAGPRSSSETPSVAVDVANHPLANRIRKNLRRLAAWRKQHDIECYRAYDADIPELAFAIDVYGDHVHIQEYEPPKTVDPARARQRRDETMVVVPEVLGIPREHAVYKVRRPKRGKAQYEKQSHTNRAFLVQEGGHRFWVNLHDYLDTGLFLDHRQTRAELARSSPGKDVLNLFCYTGTATVYAAAAGARSTTSVDLSATYLDWAYDNLQANALVGRAHQLVRADVLEWLDRCTQRFDVVFLDPPTFSNSKRMEGTWDVQRDHPALLERVHGVLRPGGVLLFSTNAQRFRLEVATVERFFHWEEITAQTASPDYRRPAHRAWRMTKAHPREPDANL